LAADVSQRIIAFGVGELPARREETRAPLSIQRSASACNALVGELQRPGLSYSEHQARAVKTAVRINPILV
jgi:hypothetical protein